MKRILDLIFPDNIYCISCGSMIDRTRPYSLCDTCMKDLHWITGRSCSVCGKALADIYDGDICYDCMSTHHAFDRGISCVEYGNAERAMMMDFKYGGRSYMARHIGEIMYDRLMLEDALPDVITSVPIHRNRRNERGYDQSELLAKEISSRSGIPYMKLLKRTRETAPLRNLSREERFASLNGAFEIADPAGIPGKRGYEGLDILIVDDIYTTGATVDACAKVLKDNIPCKVFVLTFASGYNRRIMV